MSDETVPPELEVKDFKFQQLCKVRIFESSAQEKPTSTSLITSSSKYGLTFIGVAKGYKVLRTTEFVEQDKVHSADRMKHVITDFPSLVDVPVGLDVTHLALSCDDLTLAVATSGSGQQHTYLYNTTSIVGQTTGDVQPFHTIVCDGQAPLIDLSWNPIEPNLLLICYSTGRLDIYVGQELKACVPDAKAKCVCWSPKGKQLVAGKDDGSLMQYDLDLKEKKKWDCPHILSGIFEAVDVVWLSKFSFLVAYIQVASASSEQPTAVLTNGSKDGQTSYTLFEDVCFGNGDMRQRKYYFTFLQKWDIVIAASSTSSEIEVIGKHLDDSSKWTRWKLDDDAIAVCPLTDEYLDTYPIGITIDLSLQTTVAAGDNKMYPPSPLMLLLTTEGLIVPYHVFYVHPGAAQITVPPQALDLLGARKSGTLPPAKFNPERSQSPQALPPSYQGVAKVQSIQPPPQYTPHSPTHVQPPIYPRRGIQSDVDESFSNSVHQQFSRSTLDEIQHFEKELGEMHTRMDMTDFYIGSKEDMKRLKVQTQEMDRFCTEIKITVQEQNKDIQDQRELCLDMLSMVEDCHLRRQHLRNDPQHLHLLKLQALDPGSNNMLQQLQLQHQVLEQMLREVNHILDMQWEDYQIRKKNKTTRVQLPTSDTVYRVIKSNFTLIMAQMKKLQELEDKLKQLKLYNRTAVWSNPSTYRYNDTAELSSLTDALLSEKLVKSLSVKSSESSEKQNSENRVEQLREYLCQQPVLILKSTIPGNLSVLRNPDSQIEQPSVLSNPQGQSLDLEGNFMRMDRRSSPLTQTTTLKSTEINRKNEQGSIEFDKNMESSLMKVLQAGENKGTIPPQNVQGKPSLAVATAASNPSQSKTSSSKTEMFSGTFIPTSVPTKDQSNVSIPKTVDELSLQKESAPFTRVPTQESAMGFGLMKPPCQNVMFTQHPQGRSVREPNNMKYEDITPTESENDVEETEDDDYDEDEEDDSSESDGNGFGLQYNMPPLADTALVISSTPINTRASYQSSQAGSETITPNIPVSRKLFGTEESKPSSKDVLNFGPIADECSASLKTSMPAVCKTRAESNPAVVTTTKGFTFNPSVSTVAGAGSQSDSKAAAGFSFSFLTSTPKFGSKTDIPSELKSEAQSFPKTVMQSTVSKTERQSTASGDVKAQGENAKNVTASKMGTASSGSLFSFGGSTTKPVSAFGTGNTTGTATNLFGKSATSTESSTVKSKVSNPYTTTNTLPSDGQAAVDFLSASIVPVTGHFSGTEETASIRVTAAEPSNAATARPTSQPSVPGGLAPSGAETKTSALFGQGSAASAVPLVQTTSSSSTTGAFFGHAAAGTVGTGGVSQPATYSQSTFFFGSVQPTVGSAVSTGVNSQPTSSTGLFGQSSSTAPTNGGLLVQSSTNGAAPFGQSSTSETSNGGLFEPLATTNSASSSGGFFGQSTTTTTAPTTNLFGQPIKTTTAPVTGHFAQPSGTSGATSLNGGLFNQAAPTTGGFFGQSPQGSSGGTFGQAGGLFGHLLSSSTLPFGSPSSTASNGTGLFGQPPSSDSGRHFGQPSGNSLFGPSPAGDSDVKGSMLGSATASTGFGFGQSATPTFGKPAFGQSPFDQTSSTGPSFEQNDGDMFSGLGGKPSAEKANTNVFGTVPAFGSAQDSAPSFGSGQAQSFGSASASDNSHMLFSGGSFSGGMGVGSTGFGAIKQELKSAGGFGSQPSFGGTPMFGSTPAFSSPPRFGSPPAFGSAALGGGSTQNSLGSSTFGGTAFGSSAAASGFAGFANTSSPSFGALAQSTDTSSFGGLNQSTNTGGGFGGGGNTFSSSPSFTGYRG